MATLNNVIANANGCVGIGTSSPAQLLELKKTTGSAIALLNYNDSVKFNINASSAGAGYVGMVTNHDLIFVTNDTERARLNINGNVGIGTTSPTRKLHIDGGATTTVGIYIDANGISGTDIEQSSDAFRFQIRDNIPALFYTNNAERIRITSGGNVGIGTTSPVSKLHLDDASTPYITITRTGVPTWQLRNNFPVNQYGFSFNNTTDGTTPLFIGAGGNIGIGTSGPTNRLDVVGGSGTTFNMSNDSDSQRGGKLTFISSSVTGRQFYVGTTSAIYNLVFGIDSVEKARIDTAGNLGIGTTSPAYKLDVAGSVYSSNYFSVLTAATYGPSDNSAAMQVFGSTGSGGLTNTIKLLTGGSERVRIDSSGNVGIGTSSPTAKLQTYATNTGAQFLMSGADGVNSLNFGLGFSVNSQTFATITGYYTNSGGSGAGDITFYTKITSTALSEKMRIQADGNVGIGTTSPVHKLHVYGSNIRQIIESSTDNSYILMGQWDGSTNRIESNVRKLFLTSYTNGIGFGINGSENMTLNTSGNLGIGTTSPTQLLEVNGTSPIIRVLATSGNSTLRLTDNGVRNWDLKVVDVNDYFEVGGTSATSLVVTGAGNVGIGTTSPAYKFEVNGSLYATRLSGSAMFTTNGKGRFYGTASYALASAGGGGGSSLLGQTDSVSPFETVLGYQAGNVNTGVANTAVGYQALFSNTTGVNNSAFGYQSLYSNISGKGNSAFGFRALKYATTATGNSAFGRSALSQCSGGARNSAFGYYSSGLITGNPAFGGSGMDNCSFGYRSLYFNNSGNNNTAVGKDALYYNKVSNQTAIGYAALSGCTTGNGGNTAVGSSAGSAITFGYRNTMIGNNAGSLGAAPLTTGQNNTCLGNGAITSAATVSNEITLGDSNITSLRCNRTTITSLSDFRDKTDINNVQVGLSFVEKLRPVTFKWDKREWYTDGNRDGSKKDTITQIGFIAQELKALQESENATYLNLVYESNPDKLEATPGNLMVPLIKAVQELSDMVKQQRVEFNDKITQQQLEIDYLKSKLNN